MKTRTWLFKLLLFIGVVTVLSGLGQLVLPGVVLGLIGGDSTAASRHSFAIVGMFMVLFGGMLCQALLAAGGHQVAVLWAGLQKFGACGAVAWGVAAGLFSGLALLVAGFDLLSGFLILWYWLTIKDLP